ncbi:hypothetical protein SBP18_00220 [Rhodoferax ferrireducens]|uniref:hypothetical protein n=1 Tax=Rhodoferax ferrireducens TaxID=192843 RepID=UPI00298E35E9|nr:hypothetical protein [Rhodoferax ferrireducens]WPC66966.1 hypothetical protein SBP18_00220 [Rhodoferax ferrireducens]
MDIIAVALEVFHVKQRASIQMASAGTPQQDDDGTCTDAAISHVGHRSALVGKVRVYVSLLAEYFFRRQKVPATNPQTAD